VPQDAYYPLDAKPLLEAEAKKRQATSAPGVRGAKPKTTFGENTKSDQKPVVKTPKASRSPVSANNLPSNST
jgi:hypothetical protein